jgi:hypothetical protein
MKIVLVGLIALVVVVLFPGWWEAWVSWWSGSLSEAQLWGLPMLFWGRFGKVLPFVAGLVVVLDLVGPQQLRQWGAGARRRARIAAHRVEFARIDRRLRNRIDTLAFNVRHNILQAIAEECPPKNLYENSLVLGLFSASEYNILVIEIYNAFEGNFTCDDPHSFEYPSSQHSKLECHYGRDLIEERVERFILERATTVERTAFRYITSRGHENSHMAMVMIFVLILIPLAVLILVLGLFIAFIRLVEVSPAIGFSLGGVCLALILAFGTEPGRALILTPLLRRFSRRELLTGKTHRWPWQLGYSFYPNPQEGKSYVESMFVIWATVWRSPTIMLAQPLASLMERTRPAHPLRVWGVVLFVVGFFFDLLAG